MLLFEILSQNSENCEIKLLKKPGKDPTAPSGYISIALLMDFEKFWKDSSTEDWFQRWKLITHFLII